MIKFSLNHKFYHFKTLIQVIKNNKEIKEERLWVFNKPT